MTVSDLKFHKMQRSDIPVIADLEKRFFSTPWSVSALENAVKNSAETFWVATKGSDTVGYLGFMQGFESADILTVCIDPSYRGQGYGQAILQFCLNQMQKDGVEKVFLEVRQSNMPARSMYEKSGFNYLNKRINYYKDPIEDAFVMVKELKR